MTYTLLAHTTFYPHYSLSQNNSRSIQNLRTSSNCNISYSKPFRTFSILPSTNGMLTSFRDQPISFPSPVKAPPPSPPPSPQNLPHKVYSGGLLEVIKDRPLIAVDSHHRLPYLYLAAPIILRGFATEIVFLYCQTLVSRIVRRPADPSDTLAVVMHGLWVAYFGSFLSETVLYPLETVVARMTCQGMPVLVDNVQTGLDVSFVTTFYRGFTDCVTVIWESEGVFGFFRGYSTLLLRYLLHGGLLFLLWRIERAANAKMREIQR